MTSVSAGDATGNPAVGVVVVAYGTEPLLEPAVSAILASRGVEATVTLVDNGCTDGAVDRVAGRPGVTVLRPGANLGFAAGCNLGAAAAADSPYVVLVNADAVVDSGALRALVDALRADRVALTTGSVRLWDEPDTVNSAGNPVHYLGLCWAGGHGRPASDFRTPRSVAAASGALTACRRDVWDDLGGMAELLFTYYEDTELSLRTRLAGYDVRYVPSAVALHRYEFGRHPAKLYLLERNRLATLLTVYERRTLVLLLPMLVLQEGLVLAMAVREGWLPAKVRGWWWLARNAGALRRRRRLVQQHRRVSDAALVPYLSARIEPSQVAQPVLLDAVNAGLEAWWRLVAPRVGHDRTARSRVMADARDTTRSR